MYRTFNFRFTRAPFQFFHNVEIGSITNRYDKFVVYSNWTVGNQDCPWKKLTPILYIIDSVKIWISST